jgi:hypothetical protein
MVIDDEIYEDLCREKRELEKRMDAIADILAEVGWIQDTPRAKLLFAVGKLDPVRP